LAVLKSLCLLNFNYVDVLGWIEAMVEKASEQLARSALVAFNLLLSRNHQHLCDAHWNQVTATMGRLVEFTLPVELLVEPSSFEAESPLSPQHSRRPSVAPSPRLGPNGSGLQAAFSASSVAIQRPDYQSARFKCALQLLVLHSIKDMILNGILPGHDQNNKTTPLKLTHIDVILRFAEKSATFARQFNANTELRTALWKAGFLDSFENILLSKQEAAASQLILATLPRLYTDEMRKDSNLFGKVIDERYRRSSLDVLQTYVDLLSDSPGVAAVKRSLKAWPPVVTPLLADLTALVESRQLSWIGELFEPVLQIFRLDRGEPHEAAHRFLHALCTQNIRPH